MKYISVFFVLLAVSSCIKVENTNLCTNAPPPPTIANGNYLIPLGGTLNNNVTNLNPAYTYKWLNPLDSPFTGSSLAHYDVSYSDYGLWSVFAQNGFACSSDTVRFFVSESSGTCGVGKDTFSIAGNAYPMTLSEPATAGYYGGYQINFAGGGLTSNVTFASPPTSGSYDVVNQQNQGTLYSNQCSISFVSGYVYYSNSGTASVQVNGSEITVTFCNVQFTNYGTYATVYGNGYLIWN